MERVGTKRFLALAIPCLFATSLVFASEPVIPPPPIPLHSEVRQEAPKAKAEEPAAKKEEKKSEEKVAEKAAAKAPAGHGEAVEAVFPGEALKNLLAGNKRYTANAFKNSHRDPARRLEVAGGQHPFAVIVSCSDSRVPPEIIFDQGVGDLFVVRVAGHVVDDEALGSIEYAVSHLGASLIFVLGHERCGAVSAAVAGAASGEHAPGHIAKIVEAIMPAVEKAKGREGDNLTNCIQSNTKIVAEKIRVSQPIISEKAADGMVRVVGGYYDLDTGVVSIVYNPDLSL